MVEKSTSASKLLGSLCCLLIVKVASKIVTGRGKCNGYCDNKGVVLHYTGPRKQVKMRAKQSQDDLVRLCKELLRGMAISVTYHHVRGHLDDIMRRDHLCLEEDLNLDADELAKEALKKAVREDTNINPNLPYEQIKVIDKKTGQKAVGSISNNLFKWQGRRICRYLFANRKRMGSRIPWTQYENVYWAGMEHI